MERRRPRTCRPTSSTRLLARGHARDLPAAEALVAEAGDAELFLYPGSGHLFADPSLSDYDEEAAGLLKERTLTFLERVG